MPLTKLLEEIVNQSSEIEAIFIVNLQESSVNYCNANLKIINAELFNQLFGNYGISEAVSNFDKLGYLPRALNKFGEETQCGDLEFVLFWLTKRLLIMSFINIEEMPFAICYLGKNNAIMNNLIVEFQNSIQQLKYKFNQEF